MNPVVQHELRRITSMSDDQLWTRYGKMTKPEKIVAFFETLTSTNRVPKLRKKIAHEHNLQMDSVGDWHCGEEKEGPYL